MALDAALRETLLRLTPEEKAEVRRLIDSAEEIEPDWIRKMREAREAFAREGVMIDTVAEVRAIRDEI
ncbi:hypothetical protein EON81_26870 [bacterium]|nr:MAG: hypothetical protein EON81_26870 [bacterium]